MSLLPACELALLLTAAALLVRAAAPAPPGGPAFAVVATLALGLGLYGVGHGIWLMVAATAGELHWLTDLPLLALALALWSWRRSRGRPSVAPRRDLEASPSRLAVVGLGLLTAGLLAGAMAATLVALDAAPHGEGGDAWAIWNLRARFLFRGAASWTDAFHPEIVHTNYPLLLPLAVARGWTLVGRETTWVPAGLALFIAALTIAFLSVTLRRLRGTVPACLAVLALLALRSGKPLPSFLDLAVSQAADSWLGCFVTAAVCSLALSLAGEEGERPSLALAGLFAGLAAWTKNEGQLFALALCLALALLTAARRGARAALRRTGALLCGLIVPVGLLWIVNAKVVTVPVSFFSQPLPTLAEKVLDAERHWQILGYLGSFVTDPSRLPILGLLVLYFVAAGRSARPDVREAAAVLAGTLAIVTAGFYGVFLISAFDVEWHLLASPRLFIQLWPSLVLLAFLAASRRTVEETIETTVATARRLTGRLPGASQEHHGGA